MFTLTTDTSVDLPRKKLDELGVPYLPLSYIIDGKSYKDTLSAGKDFSAFYSSLLSGKMPSTSQINPQEHEDFFEEIYAKYKTPIVHITLSSGLSQTYNSALIAKRNFEEKHPDVTVHIVDSLAASLAVCPIFYHGLFLRNSGFTATKCVERLDALKMKTQAFIIADDLFHLKRGGRISGAAAVIGSLLNIKPMLTFANDGKLEVYKKAKGFKKAMRIVVDSIKENCPDIAEQTIYIANANAKDKADYAKELLESTFDCKTETNWIGPVIGAHTGSGTLGIVFVANSRDLA